MKKKTTQKLTLGRLTIQNLCHLDSNAQQQAKGGDGDEVPPVLTTIMPVLCTP